MTCLLAVVFCIQTSPDAAAQPPAKAATQATANATVTSTPPTTAEYLPSNTSPDVAYVGTEACIACHQGHHQTYLESSHSRSASQTLSRTAPAPFQFEHPVSLCRYDVRVDGEALIHKETLLSPDQTSLATQEHAIAYTFGSGAHAISYIAKEGEFLIQSPLTWYHEQGWGMSPGYDTPRHFGFGRSINTRCAFCHVGAIDRGAGNPFQFTILETAIGCERCHGPGQQHVAAAKQVAANEVTASKTIEESLRLSIANPRRMSREQAEAVCQQCHLQGIQDVSVANRDEWDFRPGLRLTDFRVDFQQQVPGEPMRIVGHVEQMRDSVCYQKSDTMTCITCHDPHHSPPSGSLVEYQRQNCYQCHEDHQCGVALAQRVQANDNDCSRCHMPKRDTNVSHVAFSNHRIGVYKDTTSETDSTREGLYPILGYGQLDAPEQQRLKALALFYVSQQASTPQRQADFAQQAVSSLLVEKQRTPDDPQVNVSLAILARLQGQRPISLDLSLHVTRLVTKPTGTRIRALQNLGGIAFEINEQDKALGIYRQLNRAQRDATNSYMHGLVAQNMSETDEAIAALLRAIEIDPSQPSAHQALQAIYASRKQTKEANYHAEMASRKQARLVQLAAPPG